ncbi:hypothetical protein [[Phormidium] sp. ETS-05]|uniref:hypothetical protein n=1 Tax=[Phormidium] sp. ETS-05 TaxID=222819 RepID=UPI0018EEDFA8|nr:hypothetical protein [[Phormidium] sp. ETS-05]
MLWRQLPTRNHAYHQLYPGWGGFFPGPGYCSGGVLSLDFTEKLHWDFPKKLLVLWYNASVPYWDSL